MKDKIDIFIDLNYLPDLLFFNYPNSKIERIDFIYDKLKNDINESALRIKIKKAKEESKKTGIKITKVKKPKIKEEDINMLYKLNAYSKASELMSNSDIFRQSIFEKQNFELIPYFKYLIVDACSNCSGKLMEKDIRYVKPKSSMKFNYSENS